MEIQKFNPDNVIIRFNCQQNCTMEIIDVTLSEFMDSGGPVCCACDEKMEFMETFVKIPEKEEKEVKVNTDGYITFGVSTSFTTKSSGIKLEGECFEKLREVAEAILESSDFNIEEVSWQVDDEE